MAGLGLHPGGINTLTAVCLYKKISIQIALYGAELWNTMSCIDITNLNRLQHFIVKKIQGFHIRYVSIPNWLV